MNGQLKRK